MWGGDWRFRKCRNNHKCRNAILISRVQSGQAREINHQGTSSSVASPPWRVKLALADLTNRRLCVYNQTQMSHVCVCGTGGVDSWEGYETGNVPIEQTAIGSAAKPWMGREWQTVDMTERKRISSSLPNLGLSHGWLKRLRELYAGDIQAKKITLRCSSCISGCYRGNEKSLCCMQHVVGVKEHIF